MRNFKKQEPKQKILDKEIYSTGISSRQSHSHPTHTCNPMGWCTATASSSLYDFIQKDGFELTNYSVDRRSLKYQQLYALNRPRIALLHTHTNTHAETAKKKYANRSNYNRLIESGFSISNSTHRNRCTSTMWMNAAQRAERGLCLFFFICVKIIITRMRDRTYSKFSLLSVVFFGFEK